MNLPNSIEELIKKFSSLPTVGPKTAERYVFYLLRKNQDFLEKFSDSLKNLRKDIKICSVCFSVSDENPCYICNSSERETSKICLVANTRDAMTIESTKQYNGNYHILGGLIDTIENIGPEKLKIKELELRIKKGQIKEIIIALDSTLEGETTSMHLLKILKKYNLKITRLAKGLPMGSNIEYADDQTISNALNNRFEL